MSTPIPTDEHQRLAALTALGLLDGDADPVLDELVALAASIFETPFAAVALADRERLRFKARVGIGVEDMDREASICAHAIRGRAPLAIRDLEGDLRFARLPSVTEPPHLRSYLGAPLWTPDGVCLGTLCVTDTKPRDWTPEQVDNLERLGRVALAHVDLRSRATSAIDQIGRVATLAMRDARYRLVVESMAEGVCVLDRSGAIVSANEAAARILGASIDQLLERTSFDPQWRTIHEDGRVFPPEDHPAIAAMRTGERCLDVVMGVETATGERRWIRINAAPVFESGEAEARQVVVTFEDITRERADKQRLVASEARLQLALKAANAGIWEIDFASGEVHTSGNSMGLFGREVLEDLQRDFWSLVHEDDRAAVRRAWATQFANGEPLEIDHRIVRADGEVRWVRGFATFDRGRDGAALRVYGLLTDITERKLQEIALAEALDAAQAASRIKQSFLANMSHEIRTPLNGVIAAAGALTGLVDTAQERELTSIMMDSATLLERVLSDLLDVSKIDAGKLEIVRAPFDLESDLCAAVRAAQMAAESKGLRFTCSVSDTARGVYLGDVVRVKQVLYNLLSNAVKFTDAGAISLRVDAVDGPAGESHLGFEVEDTGIGFDAPTRQKLFQPFVQADADITRKYGGTGLGLAISKSLVTLMGGRLEATSTPGKGSTFRFHLPVARQARATVVAPETPAADRGAWALKADGQFRALVAEDNDANRRVISLILESFGVEVTTVGGGQAALEALAAGYFDIVLMDLQMPGMDGLTATRRLREREAREGLRRTPVAILSANAMAHHLEESRAAGADLHIAKPFTPQSLADGMRRAVTLAAGLAETPSVSDAA